MCQKYTNKRSRDENLQLDIPTSFMKSMTAWTDVAQDVYTRKFSSLLLLFVCVLAHRPIPTLIHNSFTVKARIIAPPGV